MRSSIQAIDPILELNRTLLEAYRTSGIVSLDLPRFTAVVPKWNALLDPLFAERCREPRSYVSSGDLASLGVLTELFSPDVCSVVHLLDPEACLYHCHAYEIAGGADEPHIGAEVLNGWHRDTDIPPGPSCRGADAFSIFIYLTPVPTIADGPFEFLPDRSATLTPGRPTVRMLGDVGTTFVWNRGYFHRANPNRSKVRRRVLKVSIQSARWPNAKRDAGDFRDAARVANRFVSRLANGDGDPPPPEAVAVAHAVPACNAEFHLRIPLWRRVFCGGCDGT